MRDILLNLIGIDIMLFTPNNWFCLILIISYIELFIMIIVMWKKKFFIEAIDIIYLVIAILFIIYVMYKVEHIAFL
jgi:hypothetical protein